MSDQTLLEGVLVAAQKDLLGTLTASQRANSIRYLFDTLTCIAAGANRTQATMAVEPGPASLLGHSRTTGLLSAVAINAMAAHRDDLDDLHWPTSTHPGSVMWPSLLGVGQAHHIPLPAICEAAYLGYQVMARLAVLLSGDHRQYFHASTTCGGVAVAAAVSTALNASDDQVISSMSHAASGMGGTFQAIKEHSGTAIIHRGFAASVGTIAAYERETIPAVREPLEGTHGLLAATRVAPATESLNLPLEVAIQQTTLRRHPVTGFAHTLVDALLDLGPINPSRVKTVEVEVPSFCLGASSVRSPQSITDAVWSLHHAAAIALAGELPSGRLMWPPSSGALALRENVRLTPRQTVPPDLAIHGELVLNDGEAHSFDRLVPYGHPKDPFTDWELAKKGERLGVMGVDDGVAMLTELYQTEGVLDNDLLEPFSAR